MPVASRPGGRSGEGSCFRLTLPRKADATITSSPLPLSPLAAEAAEAAEAAGPRRRGLRGRTGRARRRRRAERSPDAGAATAPAAGNGSGFADDDTLRLRRIVPERTP